MAGSNSPQQKLIALQKRVIDCENCARLIHYCRKVAREKRRMYRDEAYWGKPVPSFGDPRAELLIVGLAPGAHGSNRTGRMFTGDRSGVFLYRALYEASFANQPEAVYLGDGLKLRNCYITAVGRCAPPGNKPTPQELRNCRPYFEEELRLLTRVRVVLALGQVAFNSFLKIASERTNLPPRSKFQFVHGATFDLPGGLPRLVASYHPSQQNTQTGKLTPAMMRKVLVGIRKHLES